MSLLMDALKKAERARDAKRESEGSEALEGGAPELSLDPIENPPEEAGGALDFDVGDDRAAAPVDVDLTDLDRGRAVDDLSFDAPAPDEPLPESRRPGLDEGGAAEAGAPGPEADEAVPEETAATLPSIKAARQSVDSYFDGTSSSSLSMDRILSETGDTVARRGRPPAGSTSPEAARAVFHAKIPSPSGRTSRWVVIGVLPVVLLLLAGGAYFYWLSLGSGGSFGPRMATRQTPRTVTPAPGPAPVPRPASPATPPALAAATTAPAARPAIAAAEEPPARGDLSPGRQAEAAAAREEAARTAALTPEPAAPSPPLGGEPPVLTDEQFERMLRAQSGLPKGFTATGGLKIARGTARDPFQPLIEKGFAAFGTGDTAGAAKAYRKALEMRPRSRDALLGLAAVHVRRGRLDEASRLYLRALSLNPRDSVALAALLTLRGQADPTAAESRIKGLLAREPDAPHLNFSLGGLYAAQGRWAEAQSSYFNAFRGDATNPDYVYNLAVSLDQLGQAKSALTYYRSALELAEARPAGFPAGAVLARIQVMGGANQ